MSVIRLVRDISFGCLGLCLAGFMAAFSTPYWYYKEQGFLGYEVHHGLWKMCDGWLDICYKLVGSDINAQYLQTTQAMMCIALCAYTVSVICYSLWARQSVNYLNEHGITPVGLCAIAFFIATGVFTTIAVVIFGCHYHQRDIEKPFGWSFIVAILSGTFSLLFGITALVLALWCGARTAGGSHSVSMTQVATKDISGTTRTVIQGTAGTEHRPLPTTPPVYSLHDPLRPPLHSN